MSLKIVLRGESGSGKSTLAKLLKEVFENKDLTVDWIEADHFFYDENGNYNFDPTKLSMAHQVAKEKLLKSEAEIIILSNTFTRHWEIESYIDRDEMMNGNVVYCKLLKAEGTESKAPEEIVQIQRDRYEPIANEIKVDALTDVIEVLSAVIRCTLTKENRMGCDIIENPDYK